MHAKEEKRTANKAFWRALCFCIPILTIPFSGWFYRKTYASFYRQQAIQIYGVVPRSNDEANMIKYAGCREGNAEDLIETKLRRKLYDKRPDTKRHTVIRNEDDMWRKKENPPLLGKSDLFNKSGELRKIRRDIGLIGQNKDGEYIYATRKFATKEQVERVWILEHRLREQEKNTNYNLSSNLFNRRQNLRAISKENIDSVVRLVRAE